MRVQFNAVTWYSRLLSYLFVFGIFPVLIFYIGKEYQQTVMVLSYAESSAYQLHATGTYEATAYAGRGSIKAERDIVGEWVSDDDAKYKLRIKAVNTFYDLYKDKVIASGSWLFRETLPVEVEEDSVEGTGLLAPEQKRASGLGLFFQRNILDQKNKESVQYYKVVSLDKDRLILFFVGTGKTMSFTRVTQNTSQNNTSNLEEVKVNALEEDVSTGLLR
jgi:hypothetical protein